MLRLVYCTLALLGLSGCTNMVAQMQPLTYVSPLTYQSFSCEQLQSEQARLTAQIANDSSLAVSGFRNLTSGQSAQGNKAVADEKGQLQAVENVMASKRCQPLAPVATSKG